MHLNMLIRYSLNAAASEEWLTCRNSFFQDDLETFFILENVQLLRGDGFLSGNDPDIFHLQIDAVQQDSRGRLFDLRQRWFQRSSNEHDPVHIPLTG